MLTVFDGENGHPIPYDDYYIRELASGYNEIIFNVNIRDDIYQYIREEAIIRDRNLNEYVIKQIDAGNETAKVVAQINLDEWKSELHMQYSNNSATVGATVLAILPQGWALLDYSGVTKRRTVPPSDKTNDYNVTALKILEDCAATYEVRFKFNTHNKTITIVNPSAYESRGAFATRDLNLVKLNYKGKSDGFVTRLYAEGADGLTFASINNGKSYVDNNNYSNKVVCAFWKDDRYTDKQSLLDDAKIKVAEMGTPVQSYDCDILDLANTNPDVYGFEDFGLFEVITLIDDAKNVRTDYQVVERWTYPYYPAKNKVILSTSTPNIQSAIANVTNSINSSTSVFQQMLQTAIINNSDLITGNSGGYLVLNDTDNDGMPDELLIMNAPAIETATKVWRWNQAGLGYSDNGYNGPYTLGMTMDGAIVADLITAGTFDGTIIRAGSIDAEALSVSAKEELGSTHNYITSDIFNNINAWEYGAVAPTYETINGKKYIVLDGTGLNEYNSNYYIRTATDLTGTVSTKIHLKYHIDREVVSSGQRFLFINYKRSDGAGRISYFDFDAQTIPADTDLVWNKTWLLQDVDILQRVPTVGIYFIPKCKVYIEEFTYTTDLSKYSKASIDFNTNGLSVIAEELNQEEMHYYLPFDVVTNPDRWKPAYNMSGVSITHEKITVGGESKDAIVLDGTGIIQTNDWQRYRILTDLIGRTSVKISYKFMVAERFVPTGSRTISNIEYNNGDSTFAYNRFTAGQTYEAMTEYSYNTTDTAQSEINPYEYPAYFDFLIYQGQKIYIYDLSITTSGDIYKKATLKYTADGLDSVVQQGSIISQINQSAEQVSIKANKIDLTGDLSLKGDFTSESGSQKLFIDASSFFFYSGGTQICKMYPTSSGTLETVALTFYDKNSGDEISHIGPTGIHTTQLVCDSIKVNGLHDKSIFFRTVQFYGNVLNSGGGTQFVSDRRKKRSIKDLAISKARSFIMGLKPRKYKFIKSISESNRYHHGFIAQEVKEAMPEDWGLYCEDKEQDFIGLRYDEIIADLVAVVQDQQKRIEGLEKLIKTKEKEKSK